MKALILAAGFGTRLLPFTKNIPKALFPVAGRSLLDIIILSLQNAGCKAVIINTHHLYKKIDSYLARQKYAIPVTTRYEPEILGTGGAIKNVADFWDHNPFMVINLTLLPVHIFLGQKKPLNSPLPEYRFWIRRFLN